MNVLARARVYAGMWITDCPRLYCGNAEKLESRQYMFHCTSCHFEAPVEWPLDAEEIAAVLALRPVPQTRNWFPPGHQLAVASGCPHGQSVSSLLAENYEHGVT